MTIANVSMGRSSSLPRGLRTAQESISLPEVQEILQRLSVFNLGIYMPHMHDEKTGEFQALPDDFLQVESGLEVTFQPLDEVATKTDRFLPVGWFWRSGAAIPLAVCEMVGAEGPGDEDRSIKHKMLDKPIGASR